jgi:catechol 2,3-dioxygenase
VGSDLGSDASAPAAARIDPATTVGTVRLIVSDLDGIATFYERAVGLRPLERSGDLVRLGPEGGAPLVELVGGPDAPPRPPRATGLFHLAILVPSRPELAVALRRVADAGWQLTGASDHLVSEALYLRDPEGNGIEIYRDRPRDEWPRANGTIQMDTLPLDLHGVLSELDRPPEDGMTADTRMGHVHLQVSELRDTGAFYEDLLGFDVTVRTYPGALFLSAGGYHHHVGLNVWASQGQSPPAPGSRGLDRFEVILPSTDELERVAGRLADAGVETDRDEGGVRATDPSGNGVRLSVR